MSYLMPEIYLYIADLILKFGFGVFVAWILFNTIKAGIYLLSSISNYESIIENRYDKASSDSTINDLDITDPKN